MSTILIGIDPGVKTGVGAIDGKNKVVGSMPIHQAMQFVSDIADKNLPIHIRVEDARLRKWFGNNAKAKQQGAGSVKRDCKIWEDFLSDIKATTNSDISFEMVHPVKGGTKINAKMFQQITGIQKRTSEHARDAYMLIHNFRRR
ncbi:hypothetical protein [Zunongwangia sp. SCSIO 43204]|uniref:hypothetical protein n=1 Tax=Zunongwangia sp. SCSIO 43204 TaxID=2779359 RepID=UPI001CAA02C4|nr:hypothetical protein [Zunongwangia sp. SCSIO 43204]